MPNHNKHERPLSVTEVKRILSEDEFAKAKDKIDRAAQTLEDIKTVLSSANGEQTTSTV